MNKILEQLEQEEIMDYKKELKQYLDCLLYTSPSPRDCS